MMDLFEDIKNYLPKYLSAGAQVGLFAELGQFPKNIDDRVYSSALEGQPEVFQGDGLHSLWVTNLPDKRIEKARVMVLSNTCDISPRNKHLLPQHIFYCPILRLSKYREMLEQHAKGFTADALEEHVAAIRTQHVSTIFFLPKNPKLGEDCIALLDRMTSCDSRSCDMGELTANRLFTLSNYGFYLFLFKVSIHLTRIREEIDRDYVSVGRN